MVQNQNDLYGLVYDAQQKCYRIDVVEGIDDIIDTANYLAGFTDNDEEPYTKNIKSIKNALEFLEDYGYQIIPVTKQDFELFQEINEKNDTCNNRLHYTLEKEFLKRASDYKHTPFILESN